MANDAWMNATPPTQLHLSCGTVVDHAVGTRVYNFYDGKAGAISRTASYGQGPTMPVHDQDGGVAWWVTVKHDDGSSADLDQSRMCSIEHARSRGWLTGESD